MKSGNEQQLSLANDVQLLFSLEKISSHVAKGIVTVDPQTARAVRKQTILLYKKRIKTTGFGETPLAYIESRHKKEIDEAVKKFVLRYFIIDHLTKEIINQNIACANYPRLAKIEISDEYAISYYFDISVTTPLSIREWKHFSFKAPKRKNYKDLDKQVALFLKQQHELSKSQHDDTVERSDWVCFDALLVNGDGKPVLGEHKNNLWLKINTFDVAQPFLESFIGKRTGDVFLTADLSLDNNFEDEISGKQYFLITISSIVKGTSCSIDSFKSMFRLKSKSEIHEKIIEVFSYRNDLSQRRSIIEEMFHLLFSKHRFEIPKHLILRKQEDILLSLRRRPDYPIYKSQKDFPKYVLMLAEKQIKEEVLIDQIAQKEGIKVDIKDVQNYLNLFANERLKEFVYFKPPSSLFDEATTPIHDSTLKHLSRREKTLNHILHHLTR